MIIFPKIGVFVNREGNISEAWDKNQTCNTWIKTNQDKTCYINILIVSFPNFAKCEHIYKCYIYIICKTLSSTIHHLRCIRNDTSIWSLCMHYLTSSIVKLNKLIFVFLKDKTEPAYRIVHTLKGILAKRSCVVS